MKKMIIPVLAACALLGSCSDWTEVETKNFLPDMIQKDPETLASLRAFKSTEHMKTFFHVQGISEMPNHQTHHPMAFPDSIDYLLYQNVDGLHESVVAELSEVRAAKGTRSLNFVDFTAIRTEWISLQNAAMGTEQESEYEESKFGDFCKAATMKQLENCVNYGFDGVVVNFANRRSDAALTVDPFIRVICEWQNAHPEKMLMYRGYPSYVSDALEKSGDEIFAGFFDKCEHIILLCKDNKSVTAINREVRDQMEAEALPRDRMVLEVAVPVLADGGDDAQIGATVQKGAEWVMTESDKSLKGLVKTGLSISNAQEDYYNTPNYKRVREALGILNAAPEEETNPEK